MNTKKYKTPHIKNYCIECDRPHILDNTSIDNWMEGVCSDKCLLEIEKEEEIEFNKDCIGWDVDVSKDGQFIVSCEH